jgi:hypothetical protein
MDWVEFNDNTVYRFAFKLNHCLPNPNPYAVS